MELANDMQYIQCAIIEFLVVEKQSVINIHKYLFIASLFMEELQLTEALLVIGQKE
jgi:hypothetical protein